MDILGETVPIKSRRWDGVPGYGEFQHAWRSSQNRHGGL